ncbi:SDR family NAD(P)-dependent oxidoreductase [Chitinophaga pinensis]|uniref:Short-chain dehydrogenase/reductase SDR n=1 Tax=Chitinophaga pinensis (strain ATCC 43595 / DSM 2588 / LMG 13176 / NBRC 15968 / NCIMB 11800 / UQM 2034) TaxID=485918 RepID=A0A979G442_CHIPD|nr:SDR family NAD(P)-dependent oxidoreductase [Chitinophaga pinensis]ACU60420.1 short-chain dehydrogenase/reductase SDR [Chitinophaga pinensis DSM 2588]
MTKTIFITGASRGFGKIWAEAFLNRGDQVIATARDISHLKDLVGNYGEKIFPLKLDVNDRDAVFAAVKAGKEHFGAIDVLINNAGYGLFGAIEETTEQEARDQMETNFFGLLWVTQAVLPIMREQNSGHIIQLSSVLGVVTVPTLGLYNASKFAVEGLTESLAQEVAELGIKVSMVEPNAFSTDWGGASAIHTNANPVYDKVKADLQAGFTPDFFGKPEATTQAILKLVDSEKPPLRLFLGSKAYPWVKQVYQTRYAEWDAWSEVSNEAHGH